MGWYLIRRFLLLKTLCKPKRVDPFIRHMRVLYTCKFLILVISVKDHQVTLESGVIVRLRNSKVLVFAKLISSFYSKFALSCRFKRTFVTGHGHIILHVNKKIGKLLLTIFLSLMIHSACGLVLAKC